MDNVKARADAMNGRKPARLQPALIAQAQQEYAATVDAATKHPDADGRRILTAEHCSLHAAIDAYRRDGDASNLRGVIDECRRTRELWS